MIAYIIPMHPESGELDNGCDGSTYCPPTFLVGAYFFTQTNAGWTLTSRADLATKISGMFDVDKFKVQEWPGHGLVVAFTPSYDYQGQSVTNLTLIALQPDRVIELLDTSLSTDADLISGGVDGLDCQVVLDPEYVQRKDVSIDSAACDDTKGHWHLEGDRIRLNFGPRR